MYERNGAKLEVDHITSSRVDMLIAVYDAAVASIDEVLQAIEGGRSHDAVLAQSHTVVLIGLIENGLDLSQGEIPNRIKDLCGFVERVLLHGNRSEIAVARRVVENLRDGFVGIRDEANRLEDVGKLPQLSTACAVDTVI